VLDVGAAGDLRHHAAEPPVQLVLRADHGGEDAGAVLDDGGGRFVARSLYPQYFHKCL